MSSTEIMSSNISDPLPKKYDNPSEKVRKTSGDLDYTEKFIGPYYWHGCHRRE